MSVCETVTQTEYDATVAAMTARCDATERVDALKASWRANPALGASLSLADKLAALAAAKAGAPQVLAIGQRVRISAYETKANGLPCDTGTVDRIEGTGMCPIGVTLDVPHPRKGAQWAFAATSLSPIEGESA